VIYGFHADGSECHSRHCALKHVPLNEGMDTRPSAELEEKVLGNLKAVGERLSKMEAEGLITRRKPWEKMPEIKFPPAPYSQEWWEQLTPEQRQRVIERFTQAVSQLTAAIQPFVQALQQVAVPALQEFNRAFRPFAEELKRIQAEHEHAGDEPTDMERDDEALDIHADGGLHDLAPPNAGSAT
jgi:hypothetical protein